MSDNQSFALLVKMENMYSTLSSSEKQVADYIQKNPHEVIRLSIAGLAEACGSSEATVIRMARKIGLTGFQELKIVLAQGLVSPLQSIHEEIGKNDNTSMVIDKVFQGAMQTLTYTRGIVNTQDIERAVDVIRKARSVMILGHGNSRSSAMDFQHKLLRLGISAATYTDSHFSRIAMTLLDERDVVIALSHSGSSRDIVECAKLARSRGAVVIALTSLGPSPLSHAADINLHTLSQETKYRIVSMNSRIAQAALLDSIYTLIAMSDEQRAIHHFQEVENALQQTKF